jgi:ElaB/YqjD/DUF883 family membrane-anchored ribosome-binding protein
METNRDREPRTNLEGGWEPEPSRSMGEAARTMGESARSMAEDAGRVTDIAAARAKGLISSARNQAAEAAEYVQGAVQQTRDMVAEYREGGFEKIRDDAVAYTRRDPVTALCIAAGVGLVIGWLTALGRR